MKKMENKDIQEIVQSKRVNKSQAKKLAKWYNEQTGISVDSCFCSASQRNNVRDVVSNYLEELKK